MNKKEKIEQEIQKTMEQFDNAEQLPPNPYFYTRVQARLEDSRKQHRILSAVLKPALFTILVAVNLSTAVWYMGSTDQTSQTDTRTELTEILAGDLKLDNNQADLFDIN